MPTATPENEVLFQAIIANAARIAEQGVRDDFQLYWAIIVGLGTLILFAVSFFGFSQIREIRTSISDTVSEQLRRELINSKEFTSSIQNAISETVLSDVEKKILNLEHKIAFTQAQSLAQKVKAGQSFSNTERDALFSAIVSLRENEELNSSVEFKLLLENVVDSFIAAGIWHLTDRLEEQLRDQCTSHEGISMSLFQSYAIRVLGESEPDPEYDAEKGFLRYADVCRDFKMQGLVSSYILPFFYWKGDTDSLRRMNNEMENISEADERVKITFAHSLDFVLNRQGTTTDTRRMRQKMQKFAEDHDDWLSSLLNDINPGTVTQQVFQDDSENEFMSRLSSFIDNFHKADES